MAHGHGHCSHDHDHDSSSEDVAILYSLYQKIDLDKVQCLNEESEGSGKTVFKSWEERMDTENFVVSDLDEELLFYVPFTGDVKLKGLRVIGGGGDTHPSELRIFKNRPLLGFDEVRGPPDQVIELTHDETAQVEYTVKPTKFASCQSLLLHFSKNFGGENTEIYYIGLRGEFTKGHRHGVTICSYEARPNPADHKTEEHNPSSNFVQ